METPVATTTLPTISEAIFDPIPGGGLEGRGQGGKVSLPSPVTF